MMNDEVNAFTSSFIVHTSSFPQHRPRIVRTFGPRCRRESRRCAARELVAAEPMHAPLACDRLNCRLLSRASVQRAAKPASRCPRLQQGALGGRLRSDETSHLLSILLIRQVLRIAGAT